MADYKPIKIGDYVEVTYDALYAVSVADPGSVYYFAENFTGVIGKVEKIIQELNQERFTIRPINYINQRDYFTTEIVFSRDEIFITYNIAALWKAWYHGKI